VGSDWGALGTRVVARGLLAGQDEPLAARCAVGADSPRANTRPVMTGLATCRARPPVGKRSGITGQEEDYMKASGESQKSPTDPRRDGIIEVKFRSGPPAIYPLTIAGHLWASVEWSPSRRRWCVEDGIGRCLVHVEHIHGEDVDAAAAVRLAVAMIRDGRMPTPEEANEALLQRRAPIEGLIGMAEDLLQIAMGLPDARVLLRSLDKWRR
jgi:hypothetical protein